MERRDRRDRDFWPDRIHIKCAECRHRFEAAVVPQGEFVCPLCRAVLVAGTILIVHHVETSIRAVPPASSAIPEPIDFDDTPIEKPPRKPD